MYASNAVRALELSKCDCVLASDPATVAWLTGFAAEILSGPSPFAAPPLALVRSDASVVLVVSTDEEHAVGGIGAEVRSYEGFSLGELDPERKRLDVVGSLGLQGRVGIEAASLPVQLIAAVGEETEDVGAQLRRARAVKTPEEIERIHEGIRLCDVGQAAARDGARAGITELELWAEVACAIESSAGTRLPILTDLVSGKRTAEMGGPPSTRQLGDGDLVLADIVPRSGAYWGDSCATVAIGDQSDPVRDAHARAVEALDRGVAALRAGITAGEADAICRAGLDYPHHTGHGVGVTYHEEPRIVPDSTTVLKAGMVVALEPAVYTETYGIRVERVAVVTDAGCEVLSGHRIDL